MSDITFDEKISLALFDIEKRQPKFKVDIKLIKRYLKDREKEDYTVNIEGVNYTDTRPVKAILKK